MDETTPPVAGIDTAKDKLDIAIVGAGEHLTLANAPAALAGHLTFIEQVEEDIVCLKTRLEQLRPPRLRRLAAGKIARLKRQRAAELRRLLSEVLAEGSRYSSSPPTLTMRETPMMTYRGASSSDSGLE